MAIASSVFKPLEWQIAPWRDKSRILMLTGAAGGGKSRLGLEKLHAYCLKYPGVTGIVGRKDKTAAFRSVVPFLRYTVMGDTDWGEYHKSEGLFEYKNGSMLWVVGLRDESQRENLRSIGKDGSADIALFEEANKLTLDDHQEISARLRGRTGGFRQIIYMTNPDGPEHWMKKLLIDKKQAAVYYSRPEHNPFNPPDYIEALQQLSGVYYERMWLGLWVQAEGAVYPEYDSSIHLLDRSIPTPHSGRYIVTVDFGYTNPFSATLWRIDGEGRVYQVKQIYRTKTIVEDHAKSIRYMLDSCGIPIQRVETWVCDHDAEDRATLERHLRIITKPAYKDIRHGINAVKARLKDNRLFLNAYAVDDPDPHLSKNYLPTSTADEIVGYTWSDKKQDTPVDENNHGLDEMRYCVAHVDKIHMHRMNISTKARVQNYISTRASVSSKPL
jgi:PBSX family phage terminase large subunit